MKNTFKIITLSSISVLLYWILTKFINSNENKFLGALYEMSALIFVAFTVLIPVFIIYTFIKNREGLKGKDTIYGGLLFLFSLINIGIMTQ